MHRWFSHLTIAAFLGALTWGAFCHVFQYEPHSHPLKYYIVWDMFSGWGAYSARLQVIGEGESGAFYQVAPAPWGAIQPYGNVDRRHYDPHCLLAPRLIKNILDHTRHEPLRRIYLVDETWAKKFNIPDHLWEQRYVEAKDPQHYFHVRGLLDGDAEFLELNPTWLDEQYARVIWSDERLLSEAQRSRPMYGHDAERTLARRRQGWLLDDSGTAVPRTLGN